MSDSGDSASTTAAVDAIDWGDTPLDLPNFFFEAERSSVLDYVGTFLKASIQQMYPRAPNYDDNIVADLPHFLEMATYEDPLDDLPVFLERAARWACLKRVVGPEGTFYLFAELPCELRLMVWRECIPSQVHLTVERTHKNPVAQQVQSIEQQLIEVARQVQSSNQQFAGVTYAVRGVLDETILCRRPDHGRYCNSACHIASARKTPVIAKVNHEARVVALEHKSKYYTLGAVHEVDHSSMEPIQEMPVWVDKKNDAVLVNTRYTDAIGNLEVAPHLPEHRRCDLKADGLFGMITRNTVHVAVFAGGIIGNTLRPDLCQALANADRVSVVVGVFRFDGMTDGEAAVTELFGLFGEESMALVPANNTGSLRKLFTAHAAFRPQTAAEFVNSHGARYTRAFFENWAGGDACVRHMTWFPQRGMRRRPSDFDAYCEEMRGFAISTMAACAFSVRIRDRKQNNQWLPKLEEAFKNNTTFQPVFLLHRCQQQVFI